MRSYCLSYYSKKWIFQYERPLATDAGELVGRLKCDSNVYNFPAKPATKDLTQALEYFSTIEIKPMFAAEANRPLRDVEYFSINEPGVKLPPPPRNYPYLTFQIEGNHLAGEAHPNCPYPLYKKYDDLGRYNELWKPLDFHFDALEQVSGYLIEWMGIVLKWKIEPI